MPSFGQLPRDIPLSSLRPLAELDYRKSLVAHRTDNGVGLWRRAHVVGHEHVGLVRFTYDSMFTYIDKDKYDVFDPAAFLRMVDKLEKAGIIRPYDPHFGASRATSLLHAFSRHRPYGRSYGLYKISYSDKSVIWYWEFDSKKQYFHEFQTMNFAQAMAYYKVEKFKIWGGTDTD